MARAPRTSLAGVTTTALKDSTRATTQPAMQAQAREMVQQKVTRLVALLPPTTNAASANLNPLADLISLYDKLPVRHDAVLDSGTAEDDRERLELNRQHVHLATHSLKHVFTALVNAGRLHGKLNRAALASATPLDANGKRKRHSAPENDDSHVDEPDSVKTVRQWLQGQYSTFLAKAASVAVKHWDVNVRTSAFTAIMQLLRTESQFLTSLHPAKQAQFATSTLRHIVNVLLAPTDDDQLPEDVRDEWITFLTRYDDIRFYFLQEATDLLNRNNTRQLGHETVSRVIDNLEALTTMPTVASELNEWWCSKPVPLKSARASNSKKRKTSSTSMASTPNDGSTGIFDSSSSESEDAEQNRPQKPKKLLPPLLQLSAHRRVFQDCVLALLGLSLDEASMKRLLSMLHRQILPHMVDPKRLMDWLVDCAEAGGSIAILALNGLFTLITKHNLEYPDFYTKLYALLDRNVLHVRYRPRFFRLLLVFMSSTHLPAALVASFIKRLARLCLSAPPAAAVTIVPFTYNMLKAHPSCIGMIHRAGDEDTGELNVFARQKKVHELILWFTDPFLQEETDPNKTLAISSSLWEIAALQQHYLASVSGLAKIFNEVMNKQNYNMEDFLDHSYATLFQSEITRIVTKAPALAPVPKRQPIGDSFFPSRETALSYISTPQQKIFDRAKELDQADDTAESPEGPVDVVSSLWSF
ncbi:Maturation and nuclear export of 40S ribosomal subunits interacting protein [Microbotryomycetes sp. JL201]|nr:Maturation and nuclear export of 40S ribosomal subunits interacting protein [Microbotryomycetes sp. JL201]